MSNPLHHELKKEFQLERMILFSDAVFAIAITLLVIEIKIPEIHENVSDAVLLKALGHLVPKFVGFLTSFILIALYWTIHHRLFGFVTNYNQRLLWLNLFFLFFIALMPFSTGFYGEYAGKMFVKQLKIPLTFYVLNFCAAGFMNYVLWRYITHPKHKLIEERHINSRTVREAKARSIVVPLIFLSMLPVAYFIHVMAAIYIPVFIPLVMAVLKRRWNKKYATKPLVQ